MIRFQSLLEKAQMSNISWQCNRKGGKAGSKYDMWITTENSWKCLTEKCRLEKKKKNSNDHCGITHEMTSVSTFFYKLMSVWSEVKHDWQQFGRQLVAQFPFWLSSLSQSTPCLVYRTREIILDVRLRGPTTASSSASIPETYRNVEKLKSK